MPLEPYFQALQDKIRDVQFTDLIGNPDAIATFLGAFAPPVGYSPPAGVDIEDRTVDTPDGGVPIRIYRPAGKVTSGVGLVWAHDGGWASGTIDDPGSHAFAQEIVHRTRGVVVTIDYRLVSETVRYPAPLDDYAAAYGWVHDHAVELGIDPEHLALGGGGCAANMAVATTLRRRDAGLALPAALVVPFSLFHHVVPEGTPEQQEKWQTLAPTTAFNAPMVGFIWMNYTGAPLEHSDDPYLTPAIADLSGLPRTLIITSEYDHLAPDGEHFARLLEEAGVDVTYLEESGVQHAHLNFPWTEGARRSLDVIAGWLTAPAMAGGATVKAAAR
ncbi:alpha/beta hydrolase [Pseudolysinimonas yzui]|uniref:Esterase n=1 Tax=Pseudolysinimonas yzui TaxID=2708254 RepID=A0A8J3GSZ4_9MICO|nr:alpha/beta hydrolase [Pseudolysinimonas yzui]GHF24202.1 esterase [Pseudolysinimonas yzui]